MDPGLPARGSADLLFRSAALPFSRIGPLIARAMGVESIRVHRRSFPRGQEALLGDGRNPSPGPRRLVKTPDAGHPLPKGEGLEFLHFHASAA